MATIEMSPIDDLIEEDPRVVWRPSPGGYAARLAVFGVLIFLVLGIPHWIPVDSRNFVPTAAVYAIIALSMNILMGYTGQVSLGHQAFVGVGAFGAGYAVTEMQLPWAFAVGFAVLTGVVAALLLGSIALRIRGVYLALVTISYGLFAERVIFNIRAVTRGGAGMPAARPGFAEGDIAYAYLCIGVLVLVWIFDWRLTSSKAGRAIEALRDDERVAASWGINVTGYKLLAFVISGAIAGLGGALFASINQVVVSVTWNFTLGLTFVLMTVVGGLRSRPGVVVGGVFFAVIGKLLDSAHEAFSWWPFDALWEPWLGAALLLLTLTQFPGGIAQQNGPIFRWLSFQPFHADEEHSVGGGSAGGGMGARP